LINFVKTNQMKNSLLAFIIFLFVVHLSSAQQWMTSLPVAQDLALVQNKMVFMVWEDATTRPYRVEVYDSKGERFSIDLFINEEVVSIIWEYFVPVIVNETMYEEMYNKIKDSHTQSYLNKFNDNSIKILDANGNILNMARGYMLNYNISNIISTYALDTGFLELELRAFDKKQDFYTAYYLASKYLDFALYSNNNRSDIAGLAQIYLDESITLLESDSLQNKTPLRQRANLLKCQGDLMLRRPTKQVLKKLRRLEKKGVEENNESMLAFLYFIGYASIGNMTDANAWRSKLSYLDLKKAQRIINIIKS